MTVYRFRPLALLLLVGNCQANTVISFLPSVIFQNNNQSQILLLQTTPQNLSNEYVGSNDWRNNLILQVFMGKTVFSNNKVNVNAGVSGSYVDALKFAGVVSQFALPTFNNLSYDFKLRSFSLMASTKVSFKSDKKCLPYLSASLGGASNRLYGYSETPLIAGAVSMAPFANYSKTSLTYSVGAGIQLKNSENFSVGIGYEFSDLGQAQLGASASQTTSQTPSLNHVYLNKLQATLNWDR